jgi:hypothetical protein
VVVTRMMASVGSWITGSGTVSTRTLRLPCHVTALIDGLSCRWCPPAVVASVSPDGRLEPIVRFVSTAQVRLVVGS